MTATVSVGRPEDRDESRRFEGAKRRHEDCDYWGLTLAQCMRYHVRLSTYHARRARWHADRSIRYGRIAIRLQAIALALVVLALVLALLS